MIFFSPVSDWMESSMVSHILLELPLLIVVGFLIGTKIAHTNHLYLLKLNKGGILGFLLASFTLIFWMIPRWLDTSLNDDIWAYLKYITLIFLVGIPLAISWPVAHIVTKAVIKIEFLTMLFRLGWIYLISPERLCNNYLLQEQVWLGYGFIVIGITLAIYWVLPVFYNPNHKLHYPIDRQNIV